MQAVILAGGLGTRLRPLTYEVPKPMVPICGRPYLEYQLELLRERGFADVLLLTGYLGEQIERHFGDGTAMKLRIRYSREETPVGTGGALRQAKGMLGETFLLLYGDSFLPIDYAALLGILDREPAAQLVLTAYDNARGDTNVKNNLQVNAEGVVEAYEKDSANAALNYVEAGVIGVRREALTLLPETTPVSFENQLFPQLIAARRVRAYVTAQRFYDFGTPERLKEAEAFFGGWQAGAA